MGKRILVVEDQPDNRQIIRDMLALPTMRLPKSKTASRRLPRYQYSRSWTVIRPRAALNPIQRCARSRSLLSLLTRSAAKRRRRGRLDAMTTCRNPSVRVNYWQKFANSCNSGKHNCRTAYVRFWHKADIRCGAMQCPLLGVKRTWRISKSMGPATECGRLDFRAAASKAETGAKGTPGYKGSVICAQKSTGAG